MTPQLQIRSTAGRVVAWAWLAFAALNLLDLAFGFTGRTSYDLMTGTLAAALLLSCGVAYTVGLRPAIVADEAGVTVRNPLRDLRAPWGAVRGIEGREAVVVRYVAADGAQRRTRAWVLQTSPRARARAEARARKENPKVPAEALRGRTPAGFAAERLNEVADRHRPRNRSGNPAARAEGERETGAGVLAWNLPAVLALAVPGVLFAAAVVAGLL
ncbi:hypothetical protein GCM10009678_25660 [Actinomadura kijaniata]|uniref:Low molecular weight protein antigen 6 PH domain-containing protein n=1 Tax=Actinomadura namibiensis TaxID=182080 RepID=A0A7W3LUI3_ACTNM|nr:PH domain-containing protein [Actinomadura namibiensis]MBA8954558.1 hypothetical protein [Actinomadura namibiensis]